MKIIHTYTQNSQLQVDLVSKRHLIINQFQQFPSTISFINIHSSKDFRLFLFSFSPSAMRVLNIEHAWKNGNFLLFVGNIAKYIEEKGNIGYIIRRMKQWNERVIYKKYMLAFTLMKASKLRKRKISIEETGNF